jgi:alpha-galactosidase
MSLKIAVLGAGSILFTRKLVRDILSVPELSDADIALMDISSENLDRVHRLIERDIAANGSPARLLTTTDRREALQGARYILNTVRVGGVEAFETDIEIPLRYGIDQCVGDTLGAGGIMYGQRGIAVIMDFCRDIRECALPGALLLNYANPNAMLTWAANQFGGVNTVGLCHGVYHGHLLLARALGVPPAELDYQCVGINHQTWYTVLRHRGRDLTGEVLSALERVPDIVDHEKVRIDMTRRFGYFSTESNGHLSEYLPWYRKRAEELPSWVNTDAWIHGETGGYLRATRESHMLFEQDYASWLKEKPYVFAPGERSHEHASYIIEAVETGRIYRGHFNVVNRGVVTNLPADAVVEVPGYVDATGMHIPVYGELPDGPAAVCAVSIGVQRLAVKAAVHGDVERLKQAMLLDPLNGAVLNPAEVWRMTDEMLIAQKQWLPQYAAAIAEIEGRFDRSIPPRCPGYRGAARKETRSLESLMAERAKNLVLADEGAAVN